MRSAFAAQFLITPLLFVLLLFCFHVFCDEEHAALAVVENVVDRQDTKAEEQIVAYRGDEDEDDDQLESVKGPPPDDPQRQFEKLEKKMEAKGVPRKALIPPVKIKPAGPAAAAAPKVKVPKSVLKRMRKRLQQQMKSVS